jgi:hypothetical protein
MSVSIAEAVRYLLAGVLIWVYWDVCDHSSAEQFLWGKDFWILGAMALATGTLAYIVYRALLYNCLITWLQDVFRCNWFSPAWFRRKWFQPLVFRRQTPNFRTYLKDQYPGLTHRDAILLQVAVRDSPDSRQASVPVEFALAHFGYMAGILAILVPSWFKWVLQCPIDLWLLRVGCAVLICTFLFERRAETDEFARLRQVDDIEVARRLLGRRPRLPWEAVDQRPRWGVCLIALLVILLASILLIPWPPWWVYLIALLVILLAPILAALVSSDSQA